MRIRFAFLFTLVFVSTFIAINAYAQIVTDGLISHWTFDNADIEGKTVKDVWGNNDGTMMGDTKVVGGKFGQALEFDGEGDYVNCGDDDSLAVSTEFTLAAWVNMSAFPGWSNTVMSRWDDDEDQRGYMFNFGEEMEAAAAPNEVAVILTETGGWMPHLQWGTRMSLELGQWYYITITYNSSLATGNIKAYLNGELRKEADWPNTVFKSRCNLLIGGYDGPGNGLNSGGNSRFFNGAIDEPAIYDRALSATEIGKNFAGAGPTAVSPTDKLALTWGAVKISW